MNRTITTCAGLGDSVWIIQKLINSGEKFHWKLPNGQPQRGKQLFDLLPQVTASCDYAPGLSYDKIKRENAGKGTWKSIKAKSFYLEANSHLEAGMRIEEFLPDLPTTYRLEYETKATAPEMNGHHIGIYASAYSNARHWGMWQDNEWVQLIQLLHNAYPDIKYVIIGAEYDADHAQKIMQRLQILNVPFVNAIGQNLGVTIEILKKLSYFIGFPSGLSVINESLGKDGIMFYPQNLTPMMNAWADPERIASGSYKAAHKCTPEVLFKWIKNEYKLQNKIYL